MSEVTAQRDYYTQTAERYDEMHVADGDEHYLALDWLSDIIRQQGVESVLDIGCGTGRGILYLKERHPIRYVGVEPVAALRAKGHEKGLSADELIDGDALNLALPDNSFDLVCEFGVLHHIKDHRRAVAEMCRVAKKGVFISDSNNFGQGSKVNRAVKQMINAVGLWQLFDLAMTRGKGYHYSDGDGVFYSYSVFNDVPVVRAKFPTLRFMSTMPSSGPNLYREAPHLAVLATR
ncbi:class I SAM-dependent methyltransferase [Sphingomonas sp. ERG5]|uniref:class I SAM-dependent methyltransferase n=1 Tax=Sphingomonas sp. ERG5 TaxID=1381597 RepID=UPI00054BBFE9|nr:class I SAM-dependent methyltransferase [Sphingomonas sp. ERG5]